MTSRKKKNTIVSENRRNIGKGFWGSTLVALGIILSLNISLSKKNYEFMNYGPSILIYTEGPYLDINVSCLMLDEKTANIQLKLGENINDTVKVWISVKDMIFPFRWKTYNMDNISLEYAASVENDNDNLYHYPEDRTFVSQKTGCSEGQSCFSELLYQSYFTAELEPGKEGYGLIIDMPSDNAIHQQNEYVRIRMPQIIGGREYINYNTPLNDQLDFAKDGHLAEMHTSYLIDGELLFCPNLNIYAELRSELFDDTNHLISVVFPEPEAMSITYIWKETGQWVPYVVFRDLKYIRMGILKNIIGGILIAIGSSMMIKPIQEWINGAKKR